MASQFKKDVTWILFILLILSNWILPLCGCGCGCVFIDIWLFGLQYLHMCMIFFFILTFVFSSPGSNSTCHPDTPCCWCCSPPSNSKWLKNLCFDCGWNCSVFQYSSVCLFNRIRGKVRFFFLFEICLSFLLRDLSMALKDVPLCRGHIEFSTCRFMYCYSNILYRLLFFFLPDHLLKSVMKAIKQACRYHWIHV